LLVSLEVGRFFFLLFILFQKKIFREIVIDNTKNKINLQKTKELQVKYPNISSFFLFQSLSTSLTSSKRLIQKFAERKLKRDFNVICSEDSFTFITHATLYCQIVKFDVSCYAFSCSKELLDISR
uniref:Ground-like domain-containing protein n=1 Tax=Elaeophora elaphi TaxID=1147741 RepID=A0A0R3S6F5_9BILA